MSIAQSVGASSHEYQPPHRASAEKRVPKGNLPGSGHIEAVSVRQPILRPDVNSVDLTSRRPSFLVDLLSSEMDSHDACPSWAKRVAVHDGDKRYTDFFWVPKRRQSSRDQ